MDPGVASPASTSPLPTASGGLTQAASIRMYQEFEAGTFNPWLPLYRDSRNLSLRLRTRQRMPSTGGAADGSRIWLLPLDRAGSPRRTWLHKIAIFAPGADLLAYLREIYAR
jgi:hypothetical protein